MFSLLVASDILGAKVNLEIGFRGGRPTLQDLRDEVERAFQAEVAARPANGASPSPSLSGGVSPSRIGYKVSRFQLFDEPNQRWADLTAPQQLSDFAQLYAFQPPNPWHKEVRAPIPGPVKARTHPHQMQVAGASPGSPNGIVAAARGASQSLIPHDPAGIAQIPAEDVCFEDKVSSVFEDTDANHDGLVDVAEWKNAFAILGVPFTTATVTDLFCKADTNNDQLIGVADLQAFFEHHPALLDSMYQRFRFYWEDLKRQQEALAALEELGRLKECLEQSKQTLLDRGHAISAAEQRLADREALLKLRGDEHARLEDRARAAARESEAAQKAVNERDSDLFLQKERERLSQAAVHEAQNEVQGFLQRCQAAQADQAKADTHVRHQTQVLDEAKSLRERAQGETDDARGNLERALDDVMAADEQRRAAAGEVDRKSQELQDLASAIGTKEAEERQANLTHQDAAADVTKCNLVKGEEERSLQTQREVEQQLNKQRIAAEKGTEGQRKEVAKLEADNIAFLDTLRSYIQTEEPLIHEEIKLREQRTNLEVKETALRHNQRAFYQSTYGSPARSAAASVQPQSHRRGSPMR